MNNSLNSCRNHDTLKKDLEAAFTPIYSLMFIFSVILNSLLLYVVTKKEHFIQEKRAFHRLFQFLIGLDLLISILIFPQILVKVFTEDNAEFWALDAFLAVRDFAISGQMVILVLIAVDRLLALLVPLNTCWSLDNVETMLIVILVALGGLYLSRFILFYVGLECSFQIKVDAKAKHIIGMSGGFFMLSTFLMYLVLFFMLCNRQIKRQRNSLSSMKILKTMGGPKFEEPSSNSADGKGGFVQGTSTTKKNRMSTTKLSLSRRIGSIKFAKVLFGVNILMITSYLPGILYNGKVINFPSYTVYYLFFLHALGDPILFFLTRPELKKGLLSIFNLKH